MASPYGQAVIGGIVHFFSPSSLTLGDPESDGCPVKYRYQYVEGRKPPETASQRVGTTLHGENERFLLSGGTDRNLSRLALAGLHMMPRREYLVEAEMLSAEALKSDPDVLVARDATLEGRWETGRTILTTAGILSAGGIPVVGRIDCLNASGENVGGTDIESTIDPPGTVEVIDWKTTSDIDRWAKTAPQLARNIQMLGYARWVLLRDPELRRVRVSHGYYQTKGAPRTKKVSILLDRTTVETRWEYADALARDLVRAATAERVEDIEPNLSACTAFGGCPHRDVCPHGRVTSVRNLFAPRTPRITSQEDPVASFIDRFKKADAAPPKPPPGADAPPAAADPLFVAAYEGIEKLKRGMVQLGGECAKQRFLMLGRPPEANSGFAGAGELGVAFVEKVADFLEISKELIAEGAPASAPAPTVTAPPPTPIAPDAPAPDVATASAGTTPAEHKARGRKSKAAKAESAPTAATTPAPEGGEEPAAIGSTIYVNCLPTSGVVTILSPWIAEQWAKLAGEAGCDPRVHPEKPLAFGGWRAIWEGVIRDADLVDGVYAFFPRGEIEEAAVPGLFGPGMTVHVGGR